MVRCTLAPPPRLCCCCYSTTIKRWINKRKLDSFFSSQSASFPLHSRPLTFSLTQILTLSLCVALSLSLSLSHSLGCPIFLRHSLSLFLMLFSYLSLTLSHPAISISQTHTISLFLQRCCPISFLWAARGRKYFEPSKEFDLRQERKSGKQKRI